MFGKSQDIFTILFFSNVMQIRFKQRSVEQNTLINTEVSETKK